jgi:sarcosine dehydrogenase
VSEEFVLSGTYELDVARVRVPCRVSLKPLYDAEMVRVKG